MISGRTRIFPYNFKTIAYTSAVVTEAATPDPKGGGSSGGTVIINWACNRRLYLRIIPPEDFLEWMNLHMELSLSFRQYSSEWQYTIPDSAKVLERVRVVQDLPMFMTEPDRPGKQLVLNKAHTNDAIDLSLDLTGLISKTGANWVELVFPEYFLDLIGWGFIGVWKLDALFTTEGIR